MTLHDRIKGKTSRESAERLTALSSPEEQLIIGICTKFVCIIALNVSMLRSNKCSGGSDAVLNGASNISTNVLGDNECYKQLNSSPPVSTGPLPGCP